MSQVFPNCVHLTYMQTALHVFTVLIENTIANYLSPAQTIMLQKNTNNHHHSVFNFQHSSPESLQP